MKCFVCKAKPAEAIFYSLACCMECFRSLNAAEREASAQGKSLTDYLQEKVRKGEERYKKAIPFF